MTPHAILRSLSLDDSQVDANALGDLVFQGNKRATAGLLWANKPIL